MPKGFHFFIMLILFVIGENWAEAQNIPLKNNAKLVEQLLRSRPDLFGEILKNVKKYEVQILYTQIDRDQNNQPAFRSHSYRVNSKEYFYPASTVKLPAAVLALEKLNTLGIQSLNKHTSLRIDSAYSGQTTVTHDSSSENRLPAIAHYIKKIFLASDNDAYNRLYEFLGQRALNEALWQKGFKDVKIMHRLSIARSAEQNRYTGSFTFYDGDKIIYQQPLGFNPLAFKNKLKTTLRGKGYIENDALINEPKDFSQKNFISLDNLQGVLKAVLFPETVKPKQRFFLTEGDHPFLHKYMSMLPRESAYPEYDTTEHYDSHDKFFMFGDSKQRIPSNFRIFNKIGQAFGYLIDNAYMVDFENKIEFLLAAVIYVNDDQIFNDDKYEYETIGIPFLANLGRVVYGYEKTRPRRRAPNLEKFKINHSEPRQEARVTFKVTVPPKITRGIWDMEAIYKQGVVPSNTTFVVRTDTTITLRPIAWRDLAFKSAGTISGAVKYHRGLKSPKRKKWKRSSSSEFTIRPTARRSIPIRNWAALTWIL